MKVAFTRENKHDKEAKKKKRNNKKAYTQAASKLRYAITMISSCARACKRKRKKRNCLKWDFNRNDGLRAEESQKSAATTNIKRTKKKNVIAIGKHTVTVSTELTHKHYL